MKSDQTIIRKNHMEPLHFITKLLDIKDPNIKSVDIINMDPPKGNHWRNMIFKNRLRFLPLKRLACLLEFFWKSVVSSAIIVRKCWSLRLLSSRKSTKSLVLSTKKLLKSWLKRRLWPILLISWPFQLQLFSESSMTSVLNMIFLVFQRLCLGMLKQSGEWLFQSGDEDEFHCTRFWQAQYHHCPWRQDTNYHPKSLSALRSSCSLSGENHYDGYV